MEKFKVFIYREVHTKLLKEQKLVITKIFAYISTRDYNNSKTIKRKPKVPSLVHIIVRKQTSVNNQISPERH